MRSLQTGQPQAPNLELRRVIRNADTRAFFCGGRWTPNFQEAEKFTDTLSILEVFHQHKLTQAEVMLVLGDHPSPSDIVVPLRADGENGQITCR